VGALVSLLGDVLLGLGFVVACVLVGDGVAALLKRWQSRPSLSEQAQADLDALRKAQALSLAAWHTLMDLRSESHNRPI